jgi:hypothetical protein
MRRNEPEPTEIHRVHLGGGLYADYDGHRIWLRKLDGNQIPLNAHAFDQLVRYRQVLAITLTPPEGIEP